MEARLVLLLEDCVCARACISLIKLMSEELYLLAYNVLLAACFTLVSCGACSLTLKMETTGSSGTWIELQRTARRYIPQDKNSS
jgi:hypothetical protein